MTALDERPAVRVNPFAGLLDDEVLGFASAPRRDGAALPDAFRGSGHDRWFAYGRTRVVPSALLPGDFFLDEGDVWRRVDGVRAGASGGWAVSTSCGPVVFVAAHVLVWRWRPVDVAAWSLLSESAGAA